MNEINEEKLNEQFNNKELIKFDPDLNELTNSIDSAGELTIKQDSFGVRFNDIFDSYNVGSSGREYIKYKILNPTITLNEIAKVFNKNANYLSQFYNRHNNKCALQEIKAIIDNELYITGVAEMKNKSLNVDNKVIDVLMSELANATTLEEKLLIIKVLQKSTEHYTPIAKETKQDVQVSNRIQLPEYFKTNND